MSQPPGSGREVSAGRSAKKRAMQVVARAGNNQHYSGSKEVMRAVAGDGFISHYTALRIPLEGLVLYPAA